MASSAAPRASTLANVPGPPRYAMADDTRRIAGRTRDPEGKRIMLEIARSYDDLAAWAEKVDAVPKDKPD